MVRLIGGNKIAVLFRAMDDSAAPVIEDLSQWPGK